MGKFLSQMRDAWIFVLTPQKVANWISKLLYNNDLDNRIHSLAGNSKYKLD